MTTERVGALRYDVILNTASMKKGATEARSALKTFRDGMKANTTAVDRYNAAIKNIARLRDKGDIDQPTALALYKNEKKVLEEQGFIRKRNGKFQKTEIRLAQDELDELKKQNRLKRLQEQRRKEEEFGRTRDFVKRRNRSAEEHRRVMKRYNDIRMANSSFHRRAMLNLQQRFSFARQQSQGISPGMRAGIIGNIAGGLGASGAQIGALRGFAMAGGKAAVPIGIGIAGAAGVKKLIREADELKQITLDLETLLGNNAAAAERMVEGFQKLARQTPLSTKELADGARQLLSYGREAKFIQNDLETLAIIAGGSTEKMRFLTKAFGDVTAATKLQGQELRQFINQGFNPLLYMSEKTGESYESLRKKMVEGKFTAEMTSEAMAFFAEKFADRLTKQMETVSAQYEKMKGIISEEFAEAGGPLQRGTVRLQKSLNDFLEWYGSKLDDLDALMPKLGRASTHLFNFQSITGKAEYLYRRLTGNVSETERLLNGKVDLSEDLNKLQSERDNQLSEEIKKQLELSGFSEERYKQEKELTDEIVAQELETKKLIDKYRGVTEATNKVKEAELDLAEARKHGGDRGIAQAERILKLRQRIAKEEEKRKIIEKRREDEKKHLDTLHKAQLKNIDDIIKKKKEDSDELYRQEMEQAEAMRQSGGPSDDFTVGGADYRFIQMRKATVEASRVQKEAERKRAERDDKRNELMERMVDAAEKTAEYNQRQFESQSRMAVD